MWSRVPPDELSTDLDDATASELVVDGASADAVASFRARTLVPASREAQAAVNPVPART